jgi:hypothetical protein
MAEAGLRDHRSTAGNRGGWCLHRRDGEIVPVSMFAPWEDDAAIRGFAGNDSTKAN